MGAWMHLLIIFLLIPTARSDVPNIPAARGTVLTCTPVGAGSATFYGIDDGFAGRKTANGETYVIDKFTAAHMTLPMHSIVRVRSEDAEVYVRINDRGPAKWTGNIIDLSPIAFERLAPLKVGVVDVTLELCNRT